IWIGGALRAPRRQSLVALRATAPSRGDPPHEGGFAHGERCGSHERAQHQAYRACIHTAAVQLVRGGSPREGARSELASGAATGGGGRSAPDPEQSITRR